MKEVVIDIPDCCAKPRQTRADVWKKRPAVLKYRAFADLARECAGTKLKNILPDKIEIDVTIAMPASWSKKKRADMLHKPHRQRPDSSNILKAVEDALWKDEDSMIWSVSLEKMWGEKNHTTVTVTEF